MDIMSKEVDRFRSADQRMSRSKAEGGENSRDDRDWGEAAEEHFMQPSPMEEVFLGCCEGSATEGIDFRMMELLGPELEQQLFRHQEKIVEYFRLKGQLLDRKQGFAKMQDICAADDDALHELSAWHGEVETPKVMSRHKS